MQTWGVIVCFAALAGTQVFAEEPLAFSEDVRDLSGARIVSGWDAEEGQIPWQLSLRMVSPVGAVSSCGGSIIHPNWGITAAHCTATRVTMVIRAGAVSLTRPELIFETTEYWNHPLYIDALQTIVQPHDVSILKFPLAISFSDRVQPIRLQRDQDRNRNYGGVRLEASGWGRTWTNGASPDHLQWVYLTGDTNLACWFAFGGSSIIQDSTICASAYNVSSQSTCQGDSGGPLVELEEDGKYTLVGIASFVSSAGCHADLPAGFIRPGHYHSWYTDITGLDFSSWDYEEITTEAPTTEADSSSESDSSESNEDSEESTEEPTTEAASSSESNEDSEETTEEPTTEAASTEETTTEAASEEEVTETTEAATSEATTEAASEEEVTETTEAATSEATTEAASEEEVTETTEAATSEATTEAASEEEVTETTEEATETTEEATETTEEATETTEAATSEATTEAASEEEVTETTEEATETTEEATETTEAATSEATTEAASEEEVTETTEEATETTEEATETTEAATSEATTEAATEEEDTDAATTEATPEGSTETEEGGAEESRNVFSYFRNLVRF